MTAWACRVIRGTRLACLTLYPEPGGEGSNALFEKRHPPYSRGRLGLPFLYTHAREPTNLMTPFMPRALALLLCVAAIPSVSAQVQDSLIVVVRVDDVQSRSAITPRGIAPFEAAVEARGGKVSWVVIPHRLEESQNADGTLAAELRASAARGHEIVLHGYNHICPRCGQSSHEMWCARDNVSHAEATQQKLIGDGLGTLGTQLGATQITAFVPPGHYGDRTTFRLLAEKGMTTVSVPPHYEDSLAAGQFNLRTSEDYAWSLTSATYAARRADVLADVRTRGREQGYYVLLLHDPFTRPGYNNNLIAQWTGEVLDSIAVMTGGRVAYRTMTEAALRLQAPTTTARPTVVPDAFSVRLQPNPSRGAAVLVVTPGAAAAITVFDLQGRAVLSLAVPAGTSTTPLDPTLFSPGLYLVRVVRGAETVTVPWTVAN